MESVRCAIAGGGPAGMMLGLLLARAGIPVLVLEKHADFLRDFRGDTLHPSTLGLMAELGALEALLALPHQEVSRFAIEFDERCVPIARLDRLPQRCKFIALMPQWDFLNFLAEHAKRYPSFALRTEAEVSGLIEESGRVVGLRAETPDGPIEVRADLVIGADGRHSTVRAAAGLEVRALGVPLDVLWFRISRRESDPGEVMARFAKRRMCVMIDRGGYWQVAYLIRKGSFDAVKARGLDAFRDEVRRAIPYLDTRVGEIASWDDVRLLTVAIDRLERWHRPGLLCIGDAAHAMSPVGGVGINLAIQDAVATANILAGRLRDGAPASDDLARVQRRREFPTRVTQRLQMLVQNGLIDPILRGEREAVPPLAMRIIGRCSMLQRFAGRLMGVGVRPEHVRTPSP
jgi:2-polyprenyl-6-methoxyphenol hydroxylase-like FAD-dependent oxidoreductase